MSLTFSVRRTSGYPHFGQQLLEVCDPLPNGTRGGREALPYVVR